MSLLFITCFKLCNVKPLLCNPASHLQVVNNLMLGLGIRSSHNKFGLFEVCGEESRFIQGRSCVADLLAKFEKQKEMQQQQQQQGETVKKWRLFFKIHCFKSISAVPLDSIEGTFLFEQVCLVDS